MRHLTPEESDRNDEQEAEWIESRTEELATAWMAEMLTEFTPEFVATFNRPVFELQAIEELKKLKSNQQGEYDGRQQQSRAYARAVALGRQRQRDAAHPARARE